MFQCHRDSFDEQCAILYSLLSLNNKEFIGIIGSVAFLESPGIAAHIHHRALRLPAQFTFRFAHIGKTLCDITQPAFYDFIWPFQLNYNL